jgi:predicted transcriptional regulator
VVERLAKTNMTQTAIGDLVGLSQSQVQRLIARKKRDDAIWFGLGDKR